MAYPWDVPNVRPNLTVLAKLRAGDTLSVLKSGQGSVMKGYLGRGGRGLREIFDVQTGGLFQGMERTKKGETLLDDEQYLKPLTKVFRAAAEMWTYHINAIPKREIKAAFEGVCRMR